MEQINVNAPLPYRRNSNHHRALVALGRGDASAESIRRQLGTMLGITATEQMLRLMGQRGHIHSLGKGVWSLSQAGLDVSMALGPIDDPAKRSTAHKPTENLFARPVYQPTELGDLCMRPGAYDFRKYPSRMAGERVWYGAGLRRTEVQQ